MDSRNKKIVLFTSMVLIIIVAVSLFYSVNNNNKDLEFKTGVYFCKMDIIVEGNTKVYKWNIAIAKNNSVSGLIENKSNGVNLEKFRDTVVEIKQKRFEVLLEIIYLLFVLIIFASVQKDSQILKNESNKKFFQLFIALLVIFLIYKISISSFELNLLYKDINFYYRLIL